MDARRLRIPRSDSGRFNRLNQTPKASDSVEARPMESRTMAVTFCALRSIFAARRSPAPQPKVVWVRTVKPGVVQASGVFGGVISIKLKYERICGVRREKPTPIARLIKYKFWISILHARCLFTFISSWLHL